MKPAVRLVLLVLFASTGLLLPSFNATAQNFTAYDLIAAVNALRASRGLAPYEIDGGLMGYAQEHSEYQARTGISTHTHSDGLSPWAYGVTENIAAGTTSFVTLDWIIYQVWSDSIHMNTMVGYESGFAGVGIAQTGDQVYVTLDVRPGTSAATLAPSGSSQSPAIPAGTQIALVPLVMATPGANGSIVHPVGYGQSLWSIAIAYGVKIDEIRGLNGLAPGSTDIYAGQKLLIRPAGSVSTPAAQEAGTPEAPPTDGKGAEGFEAAPETAAVAVAPSETAASKPALAPIESLVPAPTPTNKPLLELSGRSGRRVLAALLILVGAVGVGWVIRTGFRKQE